MSVTHRRRASFGIAGVIAVAIAAANPPATANDEPVQRGDQLVYPEGWAIPRFMTPIEERFSHRTLRSMLPSTDPPTGPVHCVAEYEPMEALLIAWEGTSSWKNLLAQMAAHISTTGNAGLYVVIDSGSEQSSSFSALAAAGADMDRVTFVVCPTDTIWIRDYGPRYIYEGSCRAIVDHTYNRPSRVLDNAFNLYFGEFKNQARYQIPLTHGGGNYHLNALDESNTSRLIVDENPQLTEEEIFDLWLAYQNVNTTFFDPLPPYVDATQHIDMWMQVTADNGIVISDWPANPGSTQDVICDEAADLFEARGYDVFRVPARNVSGTHYTYTNVVMCNDLVIVPSYTNSQIQPYNAEALSAWEAAVPDKTVVPLNCEPIISAAGAMHCIVMHVPAAPGGEYPTTYLKTLRGGEVLEPGSSVVIQWISDDDLGTTSVDLYLSTDGGETFDTVIAEDLVDEGRHDWIVPDLPTTTARVRVIVHDEDGNTGTDESDSDFVIEGTPIVGDINGDGAVDASDLALVLGAWGPCDGACPADLNGDGAVDANDLAILLGNWG